MEIGKIYQSKAGLLDVLKEIHEVLEKEKTRGEMAGYIPELDKVDIKKLGIHLRLIDGFTAGVGDYDIPFSIQSISKVLTLIQALNIVGSDLWNRVGVEPSGSPFNYISQLEKENGIPRNPFINSGALVVSDILVSHLKNPKKEFLSFVRELANDNTINYDENIYSSEKITGFRNHATANLLKSFNNIHNPVEEVLDFYFLQCSLKMTCDQLSRTFFCFVNGGKNVIGKDFLSSNQVKRINAIMLTCGFYNGAGEFAFDVGLPGKSGVGGGIIAIYPEKYCISVWSPGLNAKGNSLLGIRALTMFTSKTQLSIF